MDNIKLENPIEILAYDNITNRIKTNYPKIESLLNETNNSQSWFIMQGSEGSTEVVEIVNVELENG